jgi:hypothetical protein
MARRRSLAERVVWAVTATVAPLVGLQSVLAYVTMHEQEDDLSDTMLSREVQQIVAHTMQPGLTPTGMLVDSTLVSAWLARAGAGGESIPAPMRDLAPGLYHFDPGRQVAPRRRHRHRDGRLTVVLDATAAEERVYRFGYTLARSGSAASPARSGSRAASPRSPSARSSPRRERSPARRPGSR